MDLKKLFKNNDAVSPVIGVILMVAITVILAAAIGSSVFGQGTTKPAPQANIGIKSAGINNNIASVALEHLGGDQIHFESSTTTKIMASLNGGSSVEINAHDDSTTTPAVEGLGTMSVGDSKTLVLASDYGITNAFASATPSAIPKIGDTVSIKIIDVKTNQLISAKDVRF